jgi:hypothetical protein
MIVGYVEGNNEYWEGYEQANTIMKMLLFGKLLPCHIRVHIYQHIIFVYVNFSHVSVINPGVIISTTL